MSEWILIAYLLVPTNRGGFHYEAVDIQHVIGFESQEACMAAVDRAISAMARSHVGSGAYARCMEKMLPNTLPSADADPGKCLLSGER